MAVNLTTSFRHLSARGWPANLLLAEAFLTLGLASLAIRILPFRTVVEAVASSPLSRRGGAGADNLLDLRRALDACVRRVPWRAVCFQQGLALHLMLRRRGVDSLLHYGVAKTGEGVSAHVWISHDGEILLGGEGIDGHVCLATFPRSPSAP